MSKVYGNVELIGGGAVINLAAESVASDPAFDADDEGLIVYNTTEKTYKYNNGASWVAFEVSLTSSTQLVDTLGNNWINPDFSFDPTDFNALDNIGGLTSDDSLFDVLVAFDAAITDAKNVETLQGVPLDFDSGDLSANNIVYFDGTNFVSGTVNDLDLVQLTVAQLQDTSISDPENEEILVYSGGGWTHKPIFFRYQELSSTLSTFTVNHSLGEQFCHVTVIDMSFATPRTIDPSEISSIEYNSVNTLTVNLTGNKPVTIVVSTIERT